MRGPILWHLLPPELSAPRVLPAELDADLLVMQQAAEDFWGLLWRAEDQPSRSWLSLQRILAERRAARAHGGPQERFIFGGRWAPRRASVIGADDGT